MYTGTLIEDLVAAVDRVRAQAGAVQMPGDTVCRDADEEFTLADAHMWAVPSGAAGRFGHRDPLV